MLDKTFESWKQATQQHILDMEDVLIQKIAREQIARFENTPIIQTLFDTTSRQITIENLSNFNKLYPMDIGDEGLDSPLVFLPFSETQIQKLCNTTHTYSNTEMDIPIVLKRDDYYIDKEKHWGNIISYGFLKNGKDQFLPHLAFPFLPFSRKYVRIEIDDTAESSTDYTLPEEFEIENIKFNLQNVKLNETDISKISNTVVPIWNIKLKELPIGFYSRPYTINEENGHRVRLDQIENDLDLKAQHLYHQVGRKGTGAKTVWSNTASFKNLPIADYKNGLPTPCLTSTNVIDFVRLSEIHKFTPTNELQENITQWASAVDHILYTDLYWFRQFVMAFQLTESDIVKLISMITGQNSPLKLKSISKHRETPDFLQWQKNQKFSDYTWYLKDLDAEDELIDQWTIINLNFVIRNNKFFPDYVVEDFANYIASLCSLYFPFGAKCTASVS